MDIALFPILIFLSGTPHLVQLDTFDPLWRRIRLEPTALSPPSFSVNYFSWLLWRVVVFVRSFYLALVSALELTHCVLVACDSK